MRAYVLIGFFIPKRELEKLKIFEQEENKLIGYKSGFFDQLPGYSCQCYTNKCEICKSYCLNCQQFLWLWLSSSGRYL